MWVEAYGGVADHDVRPRAMAALTAPKATARSPPPIRERSGAGAIRPLGELADGRRPVGVARRHDHVEAELLLKVPGDLPDRGGLPVPLTPTTISTAGRSRRWMRPPSPGRCGLGEDRSAILRASPW
jgi:hypothetical protein